MTESGVARTLFFYVYGGPIENGLTCGGLFGLGYFYFNFFFVVWNPH